MFRLALGISESTLQRRLHDVRCGCVCVIRERFRDSSKRDFAVAFMRVFFSIHSQHLANGVRPMAALDPNINGLVITVECNKLLRQLCPTAWSISYSYIMYLWRYAFPHIRHAPVFEYGVCGTCADLKQEACLARSDKQRAEVKAKKDAHRMLYKSERVDFNARVIRAQNDNTNETLFISFDYTMALPFPFFTPRLSVRPSISHGVLLGLLLSL